VVTICNIRFNIQIFYIMPTYCIYVFRMYLWITVFPHKSTPCFKLLHYTPLCFKSPWQLTLLNLRSLTLSLWPFARYICIHLSHFCSAYKRHIILYLRPILITPNFPRTPNSGVEQELGAQHRLICFYNCEGGFFAFTWPCIVTNPYNKTN
jgi:hypothetical protein